ncbi:MAG: tRNA-dihydrouridine synthase family protein [Clostridia bacterium]|nr:tRNA-dihydrouridine synthase family protein [Clostridia bacterium]
MDIRLAPMEGVTDAVHRRVHHRLFGGVEKYYIPFITPSHHQVFTTRDMRAIAPENNAGVPCIPQLLTRDAELFLWAAQQLADLGYDEVNLNTGCPSGTVTAKGRGSGALRDPEGLRAFLDAIFAASPLPVSIKTRIGFYDAAEWPALLAIFRDYPVKELTIHPRTRNEFYKGGVHEDCFQLAADAGLPLVYNGNLFSAEDCGALQTRYPDMPMMIGRGLIANPALGRQLHGGAPATGEELRHYHDALMAEYAREYPADTVHGRMREHMKYLSCCFEDSRKALKAIRKSNPGNYPAAAAMLFALPLAECPAYDPDVFAK